MATKLMAADATLRDIMAATIRAPSIYSIVEAAGVEMRGRLVVHRGKEVAFDTWVHSLAPKRHRALRAKALYIEADELIKAR